VKRNAETPTIRTTLANVLRDGIAGLEPALATVPIVRTVATELTDDLDGNLLDVQLQALAPGKTSGTRRAHTLYVDVISCYQTPTDEHEDALDALVSAVLDVLTASPVTTWTDATRVVRDGLYPAYRITVTMEDRG